MSKLYYDLVEKTGKGFDTQGLTEAWLSYYKDDPATKSLVPVYEVHHKTGESGLDDLRHVGRGDIVMIKVILITPYDDHISLTIQNDWSGNAKVEMTKLSSKEKIGRLATLRLVGLPSNVPDLLETFTWR